MLFDSIHTRVRHLSSAPHNRVEQPAATQARMLMRWLLSTAAGLRVACVDAENLRAMPPRLIREPA